MLAATPLLLADDTPHLLRSVAARAVMSGGGAEDLEAVLERMLVAPSDALCRPLMALGTRETGERLLRAFVVGDALRADAPDELLHALGYLVVVEAEPALWTAAREQEHSRHRSACLGLVDLPCEGREAAIADEIRGCHGHNLFGEFWPALAGKVGDPELVAPLFAADANTSTDCFGGVLLGLALLDQREVFERVLFDPTWEATDSATGNLRSCGLAVRILGLSICGLHRARAATLGDHARDVLAALVYLHAVQSEFTGLRAAAGPIDDDLEVYRELLQWRGPFDGHRSERLTEARAVIETRLAHRLARQ